MTKKSIKVITKSAEETQDLAKKLAGDVLKSQAPRVIALEGELGGGKTTFLQGFAKGLGVKEKILSPTFNIFKKYKFQNQNLKFLYHMDCYRLQSVKDLEVLGFQEIISDPQNIVAIEWASKIKKALPKNTLHIKFKFIDNTSRNISCRPVKNFILQR